MKNPNKSRFASSLAALGGVVAAGIIFTLMPSRPSTAKEPPNKKTTAKKAAVKAAPSAAHEWMMFGGTPSRNPVNTVEKNVPTEWDIQSKKNIRWMAKLGSRAYGGPIVADGKVFVGTNNEAPRNPDIKGDKGVVMCFAEADGKFLWQSVHDKMPSGRVTDWPREGICSSPTVEGKYVYLVSNRCEVLCLRTDGLADGKNEGVTDEKYKSATDADIVWHFDMFRELNVIPHNMSSCCPLIIGDTMFIVTGNGVDEGHINLPSPDAPSFIALDKKTGKLLWRDSSPGKNVMHGQWSNPVYVESKDRKQIVFPGGDGWLHALDPKDGKHLWRFDCNPKDSKYDLGGKGTRSDFIATPVFYDGKIYIGTGQDPEHNEGVGHLWCVNPDGNFDVSPDLIVDGSMFPPKTKPNPKSAAVWHYGGPVSKDDKEKLERDNYFGRTMSTCAIHDGLLYACDLGGYFVCMDAKTGKLLWSHDLGANVWGSPYWVDEKIYIGNDDGDVHVFAHGKEKKVIAKMEMGTAVRSNPTVVNGILYIMTSTHLYAIEQPH